MPIGISALKALAGAGATPDMIIAAVEAEQIADNEALAEKRRKDRDRKRKSRDISFVRVTSRDTSDNTAPIVGPEGDELPDLVSSDPAALAENFLKKGLPHTPSKETISNLEKDSTNEEVQESKKEPIGIARAKRVGCRLPADWEPTLADVEFAQTLLSDDRARGEIEKFRDYWHARAGPGGVKLNWSATWRNWIRKAAEEFKNGNGSHDHRTHRPTGHAQTGADAIVAGMARYASRRGLGEFSDGSNGEIPRPSDAPGSHDAD